MNNNNDHWNAATVKFSTQFIVPQTRFQLSPSQFAIEVLIYKWATTLIKMSIHVPLKNNNRFRDFANTDGTLSFSSVSSPFIGIVFSLMQLSKPNPRETHTHEKKTENQIRTM